MGTILIHPWDVKEKLKRKVGREETWMKKKGEKR